ncbi:hypothetical protein [Paenibacillus glacialis]|uniref:Uncharacterized protein n=1 Tax=Paenibacillus glacialis TaxID=494026 RepID=A0A168BZ16_9BACL|nr:hypothetical protein [Paenibacillus glacialis]OAB32898.1 hypothetical protein PGLA_25780 [Paenibacillus glacialis]
MKPMLNNYEFKIYVITFSDIKRFFIMEIIIGAMTYSIAMKLFHNVVLASAGGWVGTEGLKRLGIVKKVMWK